MFTLHIAGVTCKDWSAMNRHRLRFGGPSGRPLLTWVHERKWTGETMILIENVASFQVQPLLEILDTHFLALDLLFGPEGLGWWSARKRRFMVLLKKGWCLTETEAHFRKLFTRERPTDGKRSHMFFCAPGDVVQEAKRRRVLEQSEMNQGKKGSSFNSHSNSSDVRPEAADPSISTAEIDRMKWESLYSHGQVCRLRMYEKTAAEELFQGTVTHNDPDLTKMVRAALKASHCCAQSSNNLPAFFKKSRLGFLACVGLRSCCKN